MSRQPQASDSHSHFTFCILHFAFFIISSFLGTPLFAGDKWLLTTAQFKTDTVFLKGITGTGVSVAAADGGNQRDVPLDEFLDLTRPVVISQVGGKFVLHMAGGDRLGGEPVSLKADSIVWKNAAVGEISIPTGRIIAMTLPGKPAPSDRQHEDVVQLSNGDSIHGIIASMSADRIAIQTSAGNSDVPLTAIASVSFAVTPGGGDSRRGFRVRLDDGSSLVGSAASLDAGNLILTVGKNADRKISLEHVTAIEQVNGPVSWLSARTPSEAYYYRFIGESQQPAAFMDRSWGGERPMEFKGRLLAHGIAVHALSRISWTLDGNYQAFRTRYAIEGDGGFADATVRIKLDDKVVYERSHVRSDWLSPVIIQELGGAKKLTLEVDGGTGYSQDSLDWIEPALLRHKPSGPPSLDETQPGTIEPATQPKPATQPAPSPSIQPAVPPSP